MRLITANSKAFTLAEVLVSSAIAAITMSGIIYGYVMTAKRAEWAGYSLAAQSSAMEAIERARSAKWDPSADPPVDLMVSGQFPTSVEIMDIPISGTNVSYITNFITVTLATTTPPVKKIRVDAVWRFPGGKVYTNTLVMYRSPQT